MSIPSGVLVEEIKQQGFSAFPVKNIFGEICIGYGHNIMNNPDLLSEYDSDLAHAIKLYNGNGLFDLRSGELVDYQEDLNKKVLSCGFSIDTIRAEELLIDDIIIIFDEFSKESSAFRHLLNLCGNGYFLLETQMSCYYSKLIKCNNITAVQNSSKSGEHFKRPRAYDKNFRNPRFAVMPTGMPTKMPADMPKEMPKGLTWGMARGMARGVSEMGDNTNISQNMNTDILSVDIALEHSTNIECCLPFDVNSDANRNEYENNESIYEEKMLENNRNTFHLFPKNKIQKNLKKATKSKKNSWELLALPNPDHDSALIRLDTLIYLAYFAGVQKILNMKSVLACIRMDDFVAAAGYMLSNSLSEKLGERGVILSRRMRYGIMISDINEEIPDHLKASLKDIDPDEIEAEIELEIEDGINMESNNYGAMEGNNANRNDNYENMEYNNINYE